MAINTTEASQSSTQSVSSRNHLTLPTEIIVEILLKLPVESLLRFKSVCKLWYSLISDPHFLKLNAHNKRLIFGVWGSNILNTCCLDDAMNGNIINNALEVVVYSFKSSGLMVKVVGSCNGLLCLRIFSRNDPHVGVLFIWNPSTSKYHKLPSDFYRARGTPVVFGFGYENSSDDYKVISIFCKLKKGRFETFVRIYSLRNGSWKDIGVFPRGMLYGFCKFLNGALHWLASDGNDLWTIISLDLATETFGEVLQPVYEEGEKELTLGTLGEWLCVLSDHCDIRIDLWAMKVYGVKDSWSKLVSVSYVPGPKMDHFLAPLYISNDGRILLTFGKKLIIYDLKNGSFSDVKSFDEYIEASTFAESLVSPMPPCRSSLT